MRIYGFLLILVLGVANLVSPAPKSFPRNLSI